MNMLFPLVMASLGFTFMSPFELGLGGNGVLLYEKNIVVEFYITLSCYYVYNIFSDVLFI